MLIAPYAGGDMAEPLNATFFAFNKRERGGVLFGASVVYILMSGALLVAAFLVLWPALGLNPLNPEPPTTPPDPMKALWILPVAFFGTFIYCVITASFEAACLRWMIRGERPGLFGMTLDEDTWRVYGLYWVWLLCYVVVWIGFLILSALVSMLAPENQIALWIVLSIYGLLIMFGAVSLAPAAAVTVARRQFSFGEASEATDEHFLPLLGAFATLVGLQWVLNTGATLAWVLWALNGDVSVYVASVRDPMSAYAAYNQAVAGAMAVPGGANVYWAMSGVLFLVSTVFLVLLYGVNARVARLALDEGRISAPSPAP